MIIRTSMRPVTTGLMLKGRSSTAVRNVFPVGKRAVTVGRVWLPKWSQQASHGRQPYRHPTDVSRPGCAVHWPAQWF